MKKLYMLRGIISQELGDEIWCKKITSAKQDFNWSFDKDNESALLFFETKEALYIEPFPSTNRLCSYFPYFWLKLNNS